MLHHTRAVLLSGETSDEGLELFEERSEGGELGLVLKVAEGSDFLAAANESMTAAEQDQVRPQPRPQPRPWAQPRHWPRHCRRH